MQATAKRPDDAQLRAVESLRSASSVLLSGHVRPDGDCLGSETALARVLLALGKRVRIVNPDPVEPRFDYLARHVAFEAYDGGPLEGFDLVVFLDLSERGRVGAMEPAVVASGARTLVVDHHLQNGAAWWDEAFLDPSAAATGLLVRRIARALGVELDAVAATGVFTSLVTDTGWFRHANTDAEAFAVAAELVERGVDPSEVHRALYQRNDAGLPERLARSVECLEYLVDGRLALLAAPFDAEVPTDGMEALVDLVRSVNEVEVVLHLQEHADGRCKLSARSKGAVDVNDLARRFGGGGHARAAGAWLDGGLEDARARLVGAAIDALSEEA